MYFNLSLSLKYRSNYKIKTIIIINWIFDKIRNKEIGFYQSKLLQCTTATSGEIQRALVQN